MSEQACVCGGSKSQPNRDCERCQLIAQRDALLAACEASVHVWEQGCVDRGWKDEPNWIDETLDQLRAAIALAKETSE